MSNVDTKDAQNFSASQENLEVNRCMQIFKQLYTSSVSILPLLAQSDLSRYVLIAPESIHYHKCDQVIPKVAEKWAKEGTKVITAPNSWYQNNRQVHWPLKQTS